MIFTLPTLPYATDALEPKMSQETIDYHYGKHLQTYVDNLNRLIVGTPYEDATLEEIILTSTGSVFNNAAQVWNHTFFFNGLSPTHKEMPTELKKVLARDFGSVELFKEKFKKAAADLFGSGWAWLAQDKNGKLHIIQEQNAGNPMRAGYKPLLNMDVWEHSYYIDYRNKRAAYIDNCWDLIDWERVAQRLDEDVPVAELGDLAENTVTIEETVVEEEDEAPPKDMRRYECITCGYIYEPDEGDPINGVEPGTSFKDIPDNWTCPACGVGKEMFEPAR